jgi:hypothetical protein
LFSRSNSPGGGDISGPAVYDRISAEAGDERCALVAGHGGQNFDSAQFGELHRKSAYGTGSAVDDQSISSFQLQDIIDSLQRRQPAHRKNAGFVKPDSLGNVGSVFRWHYNILGIKAAGHALHGAIDPIAYLEPLNSGPDRGNRACAIGPNYQWQMRILRRSLPCPGIPNGDAGRVDRD